MWFSVLGEVDLNDQYDIECTITPASKKEA
jgi:hypothetical protein